MGVLSRFSRAPPGRKDWQLEQRQDGTRSNLDYVRPRRNVLVARIDSPVKCFRFHFARLVASRLPVPLLLLCLPRSRLGGFEKLFQVAAITFALEVLRQIAFRPNLGERNNSPVDVYANFENFLFLRVQCTFSAKFLR